MHNDLDIQFPDFGKVTLPESFDDIQIADPLPLKENRTHREARKKRIGPSIKSMVKPENVTAVGKLLSSEESAPLHIILRGDFILGDLIGWIADREPVKFFTCASLGVSIKNAEMLARLIGKEKLHGVSLLLSHYFAAVDKADVWLAVKNLLLPRDVKMGIGRSHAKVFLIEFIDPQIQPIVIEGSANLRASGNIEQITVWRDSELLEFHKTWINEMIQKMEVERD